MENGSSTKMEGKWNNSKKRKTLRRRETQGVVSNDGINWSGARVSEV